MCYIKHETERCNVCKVGGRGSCVPGGRRGGHIHPNTANLYDSGHQGCLKVAEWKNIYKVFISSVTEGLKAAKFRVIISIKILKQ